MNPIALATFGSRLGPYIGRIATATPGFLVNLVSKLKTAGAAVGNTTTEVVAWARANPVNAALMASTLASMGFSASELFKGSTDPETRKFAGDLDALTARASEMANRIGSASESDFFKAEDAESAASKSLKKQTLRWAEDHFGGKAAALNAHKYLQVFAEIPYDVVKTGYEDYNLSQVKY